MTDIILGVLHMCIFPGGLFALAVGLLFKGLDRRVEALVRVTAPEQIDELIKYVDLQMADSTMSWHMQPDGAYVLHTKDDEGRPLVDSQEYLIRKHQRRPNSHN